MDYTKSNSRMIVNDEMEMICKEMSVTYFKVLSQPLAGGTEESHDKPQATQS
jgi:hypothetical protein